MSIMFYVISGILLVIAGIIAVYYFTNRAGEQGVMEDAALMLEQKIDDGYLGVPSDLSCFVGAEGVALSVLRPSGKIKIGDKIIDAVSYNDFIDEGETVKVVKYENTQLYVLKTKFE